MHIYTSIYIYIYVYIYTHMYRYTDTFLHYKIQDFEHKF